MSSAWQHKTLNVKATMSTMIWIFFRKVNIYTHCGVFIEIMSLNYQHLGKPFNGVVLFPSKRIPIHYFAGPHTLLICTKRVSPSGTHFCKNHSKLFSNIFTLPLTDLFKDSQDSPSISVCNLWQQNVELTARKFLVPTLSTMVKTCLRKVNITHIQLQFSSTAPRCSQQLYEYLGRRDYPILGVSHLRSSLCEGKATDILKVVSNFKNVLAVGILLCNSIYDKALSLSKAVISNSF